MPFVRIDLIKGRSDSQVAAIGDAVQRALVETLNVPHWSFGNGVAQYLVLPKEEWK